jgi:tRNA modification GTPase
MTDTIFALATAPGRAAIAVLRLSGPASAEALGRLAGGLPKPRHAALRRLRDVGGQVLDEALVLWLPGPGSYTGEDGGELHLHGGPAVVDAVSRALTGFGLRLAEPGEFTRRAFENGRLDLSQAEAIADLVDAETEGQRRQALEQLDGALSRRHEGWRAALIEALALLEAAIDFPDEDLPEDVAARVEPFLARLEGELDGALRDASRGERVREGLRVAIVGAPNAGKSSLLNRLLGREAAIVTQIPGTTRDVIEAPLVLGGYKLLLADTAGVRETFEEIEAEGVRRARAWADAAEVRLLVIDASAEGGAWHEAAGLVGPGDVVVANKIDRPSGDDRAKALAWAAKVGAEVVETAASTGYGVEELVQRLAELAGEKLAGREFPAATRERHRTRLAEALEFVRRAIAAAPSNPELAAEDVRLAGRALGRISGRIDPEEVLERIFATFCIGK